MHLRGHIIVVSKRCRICHRRGRCGVEGCAFLRPRGVLCARRRDGVLLPVSIARAAKEYRAGMGLGGEVEAIVVLVHLRTWDGGILRTTIDHGEGRERKKTGALLLFFDRHVHFEARAVVCHGEGYGRAFRRWQGGICRS